MNRLARILWKRDRQGFVEEANDVGVAAISIRDLQEGDPFELAENIQANNVGVEALDTLEVLDPKNCLTQGPYARIHRSLPEAAQRRGERRAGRVRSSANLDYFAKNEREGPPSRAKVL